MSPRVFYTILGPGMFTPRRMRYIAEGLTDIRNQQPMRASLLWPTAQDFFVGWAISLGLAAMARNATGETFPQLTAQGEAVLQHILEKEATQ